MTIEVRQLVVKSNVAGAAMENGGCCSQDVERIREEILDECKEWVRDQLRIQRER